MNPADEEHAHRLGRRLGRWAWHATVAGVRSTIVIAILALFWHAVEPGMAIGAWAIVFAAVSVTAWSCKHAAALLRRQIHMLRKAAHGRRTAPAQRN